MGIGLGLATSSTLHSFSLITLRIDLSLQLYVSSQLESGEYTPILMCKLVCKHFYLLNDVITITN